MSAADAAEEAGRWLAYAEDDRRLAKAVLAMTDVKPGQACYHAQQAGEKALKAALILAGVPVGRTHDLVYLGGMVPAGWTSRFAPTDLADLGRWAVEARYPDATARPLGRAIRARRRRRRCRAEGPPPSEPATTRRSSHRIRS